MIPFRPSVYQCPQEIRDFLTSKDLLEFTYLDRESSVDLKKRKAIHAEYIMNYFYSMQHIYSRYNISISLYKNYDANYEKNVLQLFYLLPELFEFISQKGIQVLDLSCVAMIWDNKYDDHLHSMEKYLAHPFLEKFYTAITPYCAQLVELIKASSLDECNIGVYRDILDKKKLCNIILNCPTMSQLSIRRVVPIDIDIDNNSLYRLTNGSVIWSSRDPFDGYM